MKKLSFIEEMNWYGRMHLVFGYWKKGIAVQGWDSFGPVGELVKTEKEAQELIKEWTYEDPCARLHYAPARKFIKVDMEEVGRKRDLRIAASQLTPKPSCKGLLYGWDGTILEYFTGENNEFHEFARTKLIPGQKLVWWWNGDKYTHQCEYKFIEDLREASDGIYPIDGELKSLVEDDIIDLLY